VIAGVGYSGFPQEPLCRDERPPETSENCPPILDLLSLSARIHAADRLKSVPLLATSIYSTTRSVREYRARKQAAVTLVGRLLTRAVLSFFVWRPNQRSKFESESISTLHFQLKHTLNISIYDTPISETNQTSS
jgi:hypothetical protein